MALLAAALPAAFSLGLRCQKGIREFEARNWVRRRRNMHRNFKVYPVKGSNSRQKAPLGVDTRIHWENENESCLGKSNSQSMTKQFKDEEKLLNEKFSDLLNRSSDYYYHFLGVAANADFEEIKAAYPRLSKEYHPDTTELPLKAASEKFMKLQEIYNVLNDDEKCKFYDWSLAASREAEKMSMKLEDLYMQDIENWESIPNMVK